jgi:hypothetical protein
LPSRSAPDCPPSPRSSSTRHSPTSGSTPRKVTEQDDVGYINEILASDADDATKKAEIMKLLEE